MNDAFSDLPEAARPIAAVKQRHERRLIDQANVRGVEIGKKYVGGEETDELCIVVLVSEKLPRELVADDDLVPPVLDDIPTDVKEIGVVQQLAVAPFTQRIRPAPGGASISRAGAGTSIGTLGTACFPRREAVPREYCLLSCNHVLANNNFGQIGDAIIQPASADGGTGSDVIGTLSEWVPIDFCVTTGTTTTCNVNYVDAAMATCRIGDVNREIYWVGYPRRSAPQGVAVLPQVGMRVQKTGRTSGFTFGEIVGINVLFGPMTINTPTGPRLALFGDQIRTTSMASPGDSGAVACEVDFGVAIGMVFAGSTQETLLNKITRVEQALGVRIAAA